MNDVFAKLVSLNGISLVFGSSRVPATAPMEGRLDLGEALDFMRVLWATAHALERRSKRMLGALGLSGPQRLVLRLIGKFPEISAGLLAKTLHLHPSTLTPQLRRLEEAGLIRRHSDANDGRRATFDLTRKGKALDRPSPHTIESAVTRVLASHPRKDRKTAQALLLSLVEHLEADGK